MNNIKLSGKFKTINYWDLCFDQFKAQSKMMQRILRQCAADRLSSEGAEEVGSSDINHELYAMWRQAGQCWQTALIDEVETCS